MTLEKHSQVFIFSLADVSKKGMLYYFAKLVPYSLLTYLLSLKSTLVPINTLGIPTTAFLSIEVIQFLTLLNDLSSVMS